MESGPMLLQRRSLTLIATLGSVGLLGGAFAFQYLGGMAPCQLCLYQRWPHGAAILIGLLVLATGWRGHLSRSMYPQQRCRCRPRHK